MIRDPVAYQVGQGRLARIRSRMRRQAKMWMRSFADTLSRLSSTGLGKVKSSRFAVGEEIEGHTLLSVTCPNCFCASVAQNCFNVALEKHATQQCSWWTLSKHKLRENPVTWFHTNYLMTRVCHRVKKVKAEKKKKRKLVARKLSVATEASMPPQKKTDGLHDGGVAAPLEKQASHRCCSLSFCM